MIINYFYESDFKIDKESIYSNWIKEVFISEKKRFEEINYIFCDDEYLLKINREYLNHDYYTDIITFDNSVSSLIVSDIYISVERVMDNAGYYGVDFINELRRVMAHGILHLCGYMDKTQEDQQLMTAKENEKLLMFHVEHK